jgi:hypothetical protein
MADKTTLGDTPPARLYKYRAFDARSIELLVDDKVYYANPADFNDPLDTSPSLDPDLDLDDLGELLEQLATRRVSAEMRAAAASLKYRGPKTMDHIGRHTQREVEKLLQEVAYQATNPEYEEDVPGQAEVRLLSHHIESELLRQYDKGVLSLGARWDCPLMWSHYGDQHHGLAMGYSVPTRASVVVNKVHYGGSRLVKASDVRSMLAGDAAARARVDRDVLLRKAKDWSYEEEWRLLGTRGAADSPLELEEVVFGVRCLPAVRHAVVKALEGRGREVAFFQMQRVSGSFELQRVQLDFEEPEDRPRRALSLGEEFEHLTQQQPPPVDR